jgi:hypothetical protein
MVIQIGRFLSMAANDRPVRCAVITSYDVRFSTSADLAEIRDKGAKALANGRELRAKRTTGVDANEPFMQIEILPSTPSDLKRSSPFESCGQSQRRSSCSFQRTLQPNNPARKVLSSLPSPARHFSTSPE